MADFPGGLGVRAEAMKAEEPAAIRAGIAERRHQQAVEYHVEVTTSRWTTSPWC